MKKLLFFIAVVLAFCSYSSVAFANAPPPSPDIIDILIDDYSQIDSIALYGYDKEGTYRFIGDDASLQETKITKERVIIFNNQNNRFKSFHLVIKFNNGETAESNFVDIVYRWDYIYSVADNVLKQGEIKSWKPHGLTIFWGGFLLLMPLIFTIIVEWAISLPFKLRPGKYVVYINIASNIVMNILILYMYATIVIDYLTLIIIMEILVAAVEYTFYTLKYPSEKKIKLFSFVITANLVSWLSYWYIGSALLK
ncbi:MAG: hypothetical protein ACM3S4_04325 [Burkholderiales bacterium]